MVKADALTGLDSELLGLWGGHAQPSYRQRQEPRGPTESGSRNALTKILGGPNTSWMELAAYLLVGVFAAVCVGGRTWLHWHRTGRLPVHLRSGRQASVAILGWGGALVAGALCASAGLSAPLVHNDALAALGVALALAGITLTMWAQLSMGESWRI